MPRCVKCKTWHYRKTEVCSFCEKIERENEKLKGKCGKCGSTIKGTGLCSSCKKEREDRRKANERLTALLEKGKD